MIGYEGEHHHGRDGKRGHEYMRVFKETSTAITLSPAMTDIIRAAMMDKRAVQRTMKRNRSNEGPKITYIHHPGDCFLTSRHTTTRDVIKIE
jgi:hypothetical protein